ncbi:hypothetical protein FRB90_011367 [Tulasnella sp. 427]|nr:hypothetical protein FRB90_011367 [Tulasnella sp. 427]
MGGTLFNLFTVSGNSLTGFQQGILFYLMCVGNYTLVSLVMVIVRKFVFPLKHQSRAPLIFALEIDRHYIIDKVLKTRPKPYKPTLTGVGNLFRSKTFANFGAPAQSIPESKAVNPEKLDAATAVVQTVRASDSDTGVDESRKDLVSPDRSPATQPRAEALDSQTVPFNSRNKGLELQSAPTISPKSSPGILGEGNLYRTESPSVMNEPNTPGSNLHTPGQVNFAVPLAHTLTTRSRVSRPALTRRPTMSQSGVAVVTASPGPRRQGTGLLFSSAPTWTTSTGKPVDSTPEPIPEGTANPNPPEPEPLGPFDPQLKAIPTYERKFGGFPGPFTLGARLAQRLAPKQYANLKRNLTLEPSAIYAPAQGTSGPTPVSSAIERGRTDDQSLTRRRRDQGRSPDANATPLPDRPPLAPPHMQSTYNNSPVPPHLRFERPSMDDESSTGILSDIGAEVKKTVLYLTHGILKVGRNSAFLNTDDLSDEELEELGGIEYRALRALTWIVSLYWAGTQLATFIILVIYLYTRSDYDAVFQAQPRLIPKAWWA